MKHWESSTNSRIHVNNYFMDRYIYLKLDPVPKASHNSSRFISLNIEIASITMSVSTVLTDNFLYPFYLQHQMHGGIYVCLLLLVNREPHYLDQHQPVSIIHWFCQLHIYCYHLQLGSLLPGEKET